MHALYLFKDATFKRPTPTRTEYVDIKFNETKVQIEYKLLNVNETKLKSKLNLIMVKQKYKIEYKIMVK